MCKIPIPQVEYHPKIRDQVAQEIVNRNNQENIENLRRLHQMPVRPPLHFRMGVDRIYVPIQDIPRPHPIPQTRNLRF
jgi:hypothetical protein